MRKWKENGFVAVAKMEGTAEWLWLFVIMEIEVEEGQENGTKAT